MSDAFIVRRGSGGIGGLNLRIKNGSIDELPLTGKQNDIFIISNTPVKFYILTSDIPDSTSDNTYWFEIATSGDVFLNLLKKNELLLALKSVKISSENKWNNLDGYIWDKGKWVQFSRTEIIIYDNGTDNTSVTGGWANWTPQYNYPDWHGGSVKFDTNRIYMEAASGGSIGTYTRNQIPLIGSTLHIVARGYWDTPSIRALMVNNNIGHGKSYTEAVLPIPASGSANEYTLDVKSFNGARKYIALVLEYSRGEYGVVQFDINKIWVD